MEAHWKIIAYFGRTRYNLEDGGDNWLRICKKRGDDVGKAGALLAKVGCPPAGKNCPAVC